MASFLSFFQAYGPSPNSKLKLRKVKARRWCAAWLVHRVLREEFQSSVTPAAEADALAMVHNSRDFPERNTRINQTTELLADFLQDHPDVDTVWYPKFVAPLYTKYQHVNGGYGGLFSMHLGSHICQRTFYDLLDVAKGPSLGTNFTLVCPYTLLAHYHELDFALSHNVPPNLIRVAVGLEDYNELKEKFEYALDKSRLHPKLPN